MKILFAGGGTAGHINPAIAVASYIRTRHPTSDIRFVGNPNGMESRLVPQAGFQMYPMDIRGFRRSFSLYNVGTVKRLLTSFAQADRILKEFEPDVVVGTGGYVSGPLLYRAAKHGVPTAIHEQNSFPGVTSKILSRSVDKIMVASEDAKKYLKNPDRIVVTGNPIREEILYYPKEKARKELGLDDRPMILSFGGSLGARTINEAVCGLIEHTHKTGRVQHIHGTGRYGWEWVPARLQGAGVDIKSPHTRVTEYIDDMPRCLAAADLVISRCGAITLSELQVQGKAAILVPSPNVAENHQYYNGLSLQKRGAAVLIEDKDFSSELLIQTVDELLSNPDKLKSMGRAASQMAIPDANDRIFRAIESILR